jgi:hypothetical protein
MRELGTGINYFKLGRYVVYRILDAVLNPKRTIESLVRRIQRRRQPSSDIRPAVLGETPAYSSGK